MKGKFAALLMAMLLALVLPTAFAADARVESIEYEGFGILKIEFTRDCDWFASAEFSLTDAAGNEIPYVFIGGEDEEAYLRAETLTEDAEYVLNFRLGATEQKVAFSASTALEFKVTKNGDVRMDKEKDRCDFCRNAGHDEDYCPDRIDASTLPEDPAQLARIFDIERCERCDGLGHDDDRCPGK